MTELLKSSTTTRSWFGEPRGALVKLQHPDHFFEDVVSCQESKPEPSLNDKVGIPCTFPEDDEGTLAKYDPMA